jgi:hypothetical protein
MFSSILWVQSAGAADKSIIVKNGALSKDYFKDFEALTASGNKLSNVLNQPIKVQKNIFQTTILFSGLTMEVDENNRHRAFKFLYKANKFSTALESQSFSSLINNLEKLNLTLSQDQKSALKKHLFYIQKKKRTKIIIFFSALFLFTLFSIIKLSH